MQDEGAVNVYGAVNDCIHVYVVPVKDTTPSPVVAAIVPFGEPGIFGTPAIRSLAYALVDNPTIVAAIADRKISFDCNI